MLYEGQSVFLIKINKGLENGILFKVEEFKVLPFDSKDFQIQLQGAKGTILALKRHLTDGFSEQRVQLGVELYCMSFSELEDTLKSIWNTLRIKVLKTHLTLEREVSIFNLDTERYLIENGFSEGVEPILDSIEYLSKSEFSGKGTPHFEFVYSFNTNSQIATGIFNTTTEVLNANDIIHEFELIEDDCDDEDLMSLYEVAFKEKDKSILAVYSYDHESSYHNDLSAYVLESKDLFCLQRIPFGKEYFYAHGYTPYSELTTKESLLAEFEAFKSKILPYLVETKTFYQDIYNVLTSEFSYSNIDQLYI